MFWPEASCSNTKTKVKIPSVITSDRWLIFAQKKHDDKLKKEKDKEAAKERINMKKNNSNIKKEKNKEQQNAKSEKKITHQEENRCYWNSGCHQRRLVLSIMPNKYKVRYDTMYDLQGLVSCRMRKSSII